ncbi:MAG: penicillin-binding protein activator LpoB [Chlorobiaceae bacterium]|nr:penicillin-binding protein activator LpoB [Chlorobiaceae bacterium]
MRIVFNYLIVIILIFIISGCGSSVYVPTTSTTQLDDKYSDTDLRVMAQNMYQSIMDRLTVIRGDNKKAPVIAFLRISNKTSEYIDTDAIADKLQIQLIKAGSLRFVDRGRIKDITSQFDLGASGIMNPETMKKAGKVIGNDYFLIGDLSSIAKQDRSTSLTYYRLSMRLIDAETDEIIWADESEVKKQKNKNLFDW